jgi:hypothetical protein
MQLKIHYVGRQKALFVYWDGGNKSLPSKAPSIRGLVRPLWPCVPPACDSPL